MRNEKMSCCLILKGHVTWLKSRWPSARL